MFPCSTPQTVQLFYYFAEQLFKNNNNNNRYKQFFGRCVCGSVKAFRYETVRMVKTEAAKAEQQIEK